MGNILKTNVWIIYFTLQQLAIYGRQLRCELMLKGKQEEKRKDERRKNGERIKHASTMQRRGTVKRKSANRMLTAREVELTCLVCMFSSSTWGFKPLWHKSSVVPTLRAIAQSGTSQKGGKPQSVPP